LPEYEPDRAVQIFAHAAGLFLLVFSSYLPSFFIQSLPGVTS
jgi:hypothetical protein